MTPRSNIEKHQREAIAWMLRLKPGVATTDDVAAFKQWCGQNPAHARAFRDMRGLWQAVGPAGRNAFDPNALEHPAVSSGRGSMRLGRRAFIAGAAAASAAAYAAVYPPLDLWPSISELRADFRTATGEQRQVALANDIVIQMNTQTSIGLRSAVGDLQRIELIAGESVVKAKAHLLEVLAGNGQAQASNAEFSIRRDGDDVSVTCLGGEVRVACQSSSVVLASQNRVVFSSAGLGPVSPVDAAIATSWRDGLLVFQDTPLVDVIAEINRYRRGRIVVLGDALGRRPVNGRFYLARLDEVVGKLQNAFGAHVTSLPGGVVVLS